jgi:hypothetical protein
VTKTASSRPKTPGKFIVSVDNYGVQQLSGVQPPATSCKHPPLALLASVCEALPDTFPFTFQHRARMQRASEPHPAALCTAAAPLERLDSPSFKPLPQRCRQDPDPELCLLHWRTKTTTFCRTFDAIVSFLQLSVDSTNKISDETTSGGRRAAWKLLIWTCLASDWMRGLSAHCMHVWARACVRLASHSWSDVLYGA